jgi:hypothetical protein
LNTLTAPAGGQSLTYNGSSLAWTTAAAGGGGSNGWSLTGNAGTSPAIGNFLGTTDSNSLELHVNGVRGFRLVPTTDTPNIIGGAPGNFVAASVQGATIGGGGTITTYGQAYSNSVFSFHGTISGGLGNTIQSNAIESAISGGNQNSVRSGANDSSIGGGFRNINSGPYATVAGGEFNMASGPGSCIGGGGCDGNTYNGNTASGGASTIAGGFGNLAGNTYATVGGGIDNGATGIGSFVGGGGTDFRLIPMGNTASGAASTVAGGMANVANGLWATIGGGIFNTCSGSAATLCGGNDNTSSGNASSLAGGQQNTSSGSWTTVCGGVNNIASGPGAFVGGGGYDNTGNAGNTASGINSSVVGGSGNSATNSYATVGGGINDIAGGLYSFAAGQQAQAVHQGAFVWGDSQNAAFASTANDQFCVRAQGGMQLDPSTSVFFGAQTRQMLNLYSNSIACYAIGVQTDDMYFRTSDEFWWYEGGVHTNGYGQPGTGGSMLMRLGNTGNLIIAGALTQYSDRNAKSGFQPVDARLVLEKIAAMPVTRWHYTNNVTEPHIGPMAQDFYAAFNVGPDEKHITSIDEGGVALAAIKGLNEKVEEKEAKIQAQATEIQHLKRQNDSLAERMNELEAAVKELATRK